MPAALSLAAGIMILPGATVEWPRENSDLCDNLSR